jgi:hypothetical protein
LLACLHVFPFPVSRSARLDLVVLLTLTGNDDKRRGDDGYRQRDKLPRRASSCKTPAIRVCWHADARACTVHCSSGGAPVEGFLRRTPLLRPQHTWRAGRSLALGTALSERRKNDGLRDCTLWFGKARDLLLRRGILCGSSCSPGCLVSGIRYGNGTESLQARRRACAQCHSCGRIQRRSLCGLRILRWSRCARHVVLLFESTCVAALAHQEVAGVCHDT